jgi:hypothetical protein
MKRNLVVIAALFVIGALFLMPQSTSQARGGAAALPPSTFPLGQWTFESITDSSGQFYSNNGACIQAGGTWYATTSGNGSGHWFMKGNSVHLHGNYAGSSSGGGVNDSFELTKINPSLMTGYLQEWNDAGAYSGYFRSSWKFVSDTCAAPSR